MILNIGSLRRGGCSSCCFLEIEKQRASLKWIVRFINNQMSLEDQSRSVRPSNSQTYDSITQAHELIMEDCLNK